jgi:hypothetical protein
VKAAAVFGALLGVAALARSEALIFLVVLALPLCLRHRPWRWAGLRLLAVTCAATALTIAPWTMRNWIVFGEPVLISLNDATVIAGANCESVYHGKDIGGWTIACLAKRDVDLPEPEQHRIWRQQGLDYAREHLVDLPRVMLVRVLRTWDLYQPSRQTRFAEGRDRNVELAGVYTYLVLLLPLSVYGAVLLRRRGHPLLILLSPAAVVTVTAIFGYGLPRFRHAANLTMLVLAAVAIAAIAVRARQRASAPSRRKLGVP